jgi:hypothetical protein
MRAATASTRHVEQADHGAFGLVQTGITLGVGNSSTWQLLRLK